MGWTELHKENGLLLKDFFKREFIMDNNKHRGEVIDCKSVGWNSVYIAYKVTKKKDNTSRIIALVVLIQRKSNDYYNFAYKDMYENENPFYYNCPKSILELLTKTNNPYALEWRKQCIALMGHKVKNKDLLSKDLIN